MYHNITTTLSDEWIAEYAARQDVKIEAVLAAIAEYDEDFQAVMGSVRNFCDGKTEAPLIFDYLPKKVLENSKITIYDAEALHKAVNEREGRRLKAIRKQHDEIRKRMAAGTM